VEIYENLLFKIKYDNNLTKNASGHNHIKHIDIKHHWIHKAVEYGDIAVDYVSTNKNIADLFTKALP
jgi:hypothetical protein